MSSHTVLPLDSYRLASYSVQVPCYVCAGGNTFDAELCRHCHAPMALAHQVNTQKVAPRMVAAIGSAAAGKTVYLGMLADMLSRQDGPLQMLARGAFSINMQQATVGALARCFFPTKTPSEPDRWNWMHCQVNGKTLRRPLELIVPDMAGEAIAEEIEHPHTFPVIKAFLGKCAGVLLLIDAGRIGEGEQDQDFFTMKMLTYLMELDGHPKSGWPNRPIALVFTKADQCDGCFEDPSAFAQKHTPGLWQHCRERLRRFQFFAAGVAGACAYRQDVEEGRIRVPLRVEPRGIIEPFLWIVDQVKN
jgi:hypothetical protein